MELEIIWWIVLLLTWYIIFINEIDFQLFYFYLFLKFTFIVFLWIVHFGTASFWVQWMCDGEEYKAELPSIDNMIGK